MPDEVDYVARRRSKAAHGPRLEVAGVTGTAVYAPAASGCNFHLYASIKKRPARARTM